MGCLGSVGVSDNSLVCFISLLREGGDRRVDNFLQVHTHSDWSTPFMSVLSNEITRYDAGPTFKMFYPIACNIYGITWSTLLTVMLAVFL